MKQCRTEPLGSAAQRRGGIAWNSVIEFDKGKQKPRRAMRQRRGQGEEEEEEEKGGVRESTCAASGSRINASLNRFADKQTN